MSLRLDQQIDAAKKSINLLRQQIAAAEQSVRSLDRVIEQNRTDGRRGLKSEVVASRRKASASASAERNRQLTLIAGFKANIEDLQKFISLESEINRTAELNNGLQAAKQVLDLSDRESRELSNESRRILAEFERAKAARVDSNDAARLAEQLRAEQAKAERVLEGILDPAKAERERKLAEEEANRLSREAFNQRVKDETERKILEADLKRLEELQARFDNLPIDEFAEKQRREFEERKKKELEETIANSKQAQEENAKGRTDENAKIKDTLDNFIEGIFGIEQPSQTGSAGIDEKKLAGAYKDSLNLEIDDLIEAAHMQEQAGIEYRALKGIEAA